MICSIRHLHTAADKGHLQICKIIVKKLKPKERNTKDIIGRTPQHFAAKNGFLAILKLLFDRKGDQHPVDNSGRTPLHVAAENGHLDVYRWIFKNVQEKYPIDKNGKTPIQVAKESDKCSKKIYEEFIAMRNLDQLAK